MSKHDATRNWALANPWLWAGIGCAIAVLTCGAGLLLGESGLALRFFSCAAALIAAGAGLTIRLRTTGPAVVSRLAESKYRVVLLALVAGYGLTALGITALVGMAVYSAFTELNPTTKLGIPVILWFLLAPMAMQAAQNTWRRLAKGEAPTETEETSALLFTFGLTAFASCWALYVPDDPQQWDSLRLLFAVLAFVAVAAAPLPVLSQVWRRAVLSAIFILHFGGIATAVLAAPPSSPVMFQLWTRIYRPYLEFMYLNNAYHFYAPEPGPASYLWFRVFYEDPKNGDIYPLWVKTPDYDEKTGKYRYPLALNYQRFLGMIENTNAPPMPFALMDAEGATSSDVMRRRAINTPKGAQIAKAHSEPNLGNPKVDFKPGDLLIPLHKGLPLQFQYQQPQPHVQALTESFAKHVAQRPYPNRPDLKVKSVKVYRVRHEITPQPVGANVNRLDPRDPELYRPFYMGEYEANGEPKKDQDPFLFWALPIQKESPDGMVRDWARRHAGDLRWVWNDKRREWTEGPDPK